MKKCLTIFTLGAVFAAVAFDDGFEPYQTIIERMPFGRPPAGFDPDAPEARLPPSGKDEPNEQAIDLEQEKIAERIRATVRVCAVNVPPDGVPLVGFTDASYTPPRSHLLAQGQSADGWRVLEIDAAACRTVLSRDGVSVSLVLGSVPSTSTRPSRSNDKTGS